MWQVEIICMEPDGPSVVWAGYVIHYTIRAFAFDRLDVVYVRPDRLFYCAIRAFAFDQLDVDYVGPDRSFYCAIRDFKFD